MNKKCPQCGTINNGGAHFCRSCGTKLDAVPPRQAPAYNEPTAQPAYNEPTAQPAYREAVRTVPAGKKSKAGLVIAIVAVVLIAAAAGAFFLLRPQEIRVNYEELMTPITVSGYNGDGYIAGDIALDVMKVSQLLDGIKS